VTEAGMEHEEKPFVVVLRSTGVRYEVPADQTILAVLEANGVFVPFSCREGRCLTCKTRVVAGTPDHRDRVLKAEQRARNDVMTICVSRSLTDTIELAL
jgi:tetrachlorobenzoquinone reductase